MAGLDGTLRSANTYSRPSVSWRLASCEASMPNLRAKPIAARVGLPSASKAMLAAGPRLTSCISSVAQATSDTMAARRRGLDTTRTAPCDRPASSRADDTSLGS